MAVMIVVLLVLLVLFVRSVAPVLFENFFTYPLITVLIYGGVIALVIRGRHLDMKYLFPQNNYPYGFSGIILITMGIFMLSRVLKDIEQISALGMDQFITKNHESLFSMSNRKAFHFLTIVVVAPVMEELFFRGLVLQSF